jgi:hypothetical protein
MSDYFNTEDNQNIAKDQGTTRLKTVVVVLVLAVAGWSA